MTTPREKFEDSYATDATGDSGTLRIRMTDSGEQQTISESSTGGLKQVKLERFDLIPVGPLTQLARHYGEGAKKYDDNQWRKGYEWSKSYAAMIRHATQFWNGEDFDEELGSNHLVAVAWHAFTLLQFFEDYPEYDDRFSKVGTPNFPLAPAPTPDWDEDEFEYADVTLEEIVRFAHASPRNWDGRTVAFYWNALNTKRESIDAGPAYATALLAMKAADLYVGTFEQVPIGGWVWADQEPYGNVAIKVNSQEVLSCTVGKMTTIPFSVWAIYNKYSGHYSKEFPGYGVVR
jgi:hypothetical protein